MAIRLSDHVVLPINAATSTFAFLGMRGTGKSYGAGVLAEELIAARVPTIIIDPVGAWWGLRLSVDGKGPGLDIPVFGGIHGDVPLESTAGIVVADLVVGRRMSVVLDVSEFSDGQQHRFVGDFCRQVFALKRAERSPIHIMFDEGHEFLPQVVDAAAAPMVGATKKLWKVGRNYGIGASLITTRMAEANKNALYLTEHIITGKMKAPPDIKLIAGWASTNAADVTIVKQIPTIPTGELIFWSDTGAVLSRFRAKRTFDSTKTPSVDDAPPPRALPPIDLAALQLAMASTIEASKANDPKALRARIKELEQQLVAAPRISDEKLLQAVARERDDAHDAMAAQTWRHNTMVRAIHQALESMGELPEIPRVLSASPAEMAKAGLSSTKHHQILEFENARAMRGHIETSIEAGLALQETHRPRPAPKVARPAAAHATIQHEPPKGWTMEEETLYQKFKKRLLEEAPGLLQVLASKPELEVVVTRETIQVDGKTLYGRVAQLLARGFLDSGKKNSEVTNELSRTGPSAHPSNVLKELNKLLAGGFVQRTEGERWIVVADAKVRIVDGE